MGKLQLLGGDHWLRYGNKRCFLLEMKDSVISWGMRTIVAVFLILKRNFSEQSPETFSQVDNGIKRMQFRSSVVIVR